MIDVKKFDIHCDESTFDSYVGIQLDLDVDLVIKLINQNGLDSVSHTIGMQLIKTINQNINRGD